MIIDRRTFIRRTTIGVTSLATGIVPAVVSGRTTSSVLVSDKPLPAHVVAHWHEHMIGFIEKYGSRGFIMPEEPEWRLREKGRLQWTLVMPWSAPLYVDVQHIDEEIPTLGYAFATVDTSFGRLRVDHFVRDSCNPKKCIHIDSGNLAVISLDGRLLGYSGYMTRPRNLSLNFEGVPYHGKLLKIWTMSGKEMAKRDGSFHLWERA